MVRLRAIACVLAAGVLVAPSVSAQAPPLMSPVPAAPGPFSNFNFHVDLSALACEDPQYRWVFDVGGDLDLFDYTTGRINAAFNYEAVLSNELQPFDPRQGNYVIELANHVRLRDDVEVGVVFHHTSRHYGDRFKDFGIAWNLLGLQATHLGRHDRQAWQARVRALKAVAIYSVDYKGEFSADLWYRRNVSPRVAWVARASGIVRPVETRLWGRSTQRGMRLEVGTRLSGAGAGVEVFAGAEQRADADAIDAVPVRWLFVGWRIENLARGR